MVSLCCMSFLGKDSSEILVAGCQSIMYKIDVERGVILQEVNTQFQLKPHGSFTSDFY
jgi:PAB-dependent poly(A)-specific ribonuclease subunit 2